MEVSSATESGEVLTAGIETLDLIQRELLDVECCGSDPVTSETPKIVLDTMEKLQRSVARQDIDSTLANGLHTHLNCDTVAIGRCRRGSRRCRLQAISATPDFDKRSESAQAFEAVFDETILRDTVTVWPAPGDSERHATRAHQNLASVTQTSRVVSSPLRGARGELVGAWVFLENEAVGQGLDLAYFADYANKHIGPFLQLVRMAKGNAVSRGVTGFLRAIIASKAKLFLLLVLAAMGMLCISAPYRISADAQIQPVTRRFVAAPFAGTLESTLVSPGDVVSQGDVLARIDVRELQWELDGLLAEYHRATKTRDSALASGQVAEAQLAKLEMERLELRMQILEHRIRHLEIKSPIDGVVVSGDLAKAEGAPLAIGQSLFEIAPLGEMLVEVAVPEDQVQYVQSGQEVVLRLDAHADSKWTAHVSKIHPRAEMRDDRNVFIAESVLQDSRGVLRPGMKGRAKLTGPRRTLAWNLFHRPYEKLVQMWGW